MQTQETPSPELPSVSSRQSRIKRTHVHRFWREVEKGASCFKEIHFWFRQRPKGTSLGDTLKKRLLHILTDVLNYVGMKNKPARHLWSFLSLFGSETGRNCVSSIWQICHLGPRHCCTVFCPLGCSNPNWIQ